MKKLNMTISILFIMFTANCMGMKALPPQSDIPKAKEPDKNNMIIENNPGLKNATNVDSLNSIAPKEKIYNNDVPKLTNLFDYIYDGDLESFKNLLEKKPILKLMTDYNGNDALMIAAYYGREEFIKFLLNDDDMNICAVNKKGENALLLATRKGYVDIVKLLVNQNSNIMQDMRVWVPAFIAACENKDWDIAVYLLENFRFKDGVTSREVKYSFKRLFIIIDELDDCSERDNIEQMLKSKKELIEKILTKVQGFTTY